jgi:DNA polymerase I-like protein with 3'-5' exonuclease and polymerase domains
MKTPAFYLDEAGNQYPTKSAAGKRKVTPGPLKTKSHLFNPGSRQQVADRLKEEYGWTPTAFTPGGEPMVSETVLEALDYPEAKPLCDYFVVQKTLGMILSGDKDKGWLNLVEGEHIHGRVNTGGAVTGRVTHSKPNVSQVPGVLVKKIDGKKTIITGLEGRFGYECRSLWGPDKGHLQVGWDASGLQLRCLAHYLAKYDNGAFAKVLLEGDPHENNRVAAGLHLRDSAKTMIYALLFGGGDEKMGTIVVQDAMTAGMPRPKGNLRALGAALRKKFFNGMPAMKRLNDGIKAAVEQRGSLKGLDGRPLHVRSAHSALNLLLQAAEAVLMKRANALQIEALTAQGLVWGRDYAQVAMIHDELQFSVKPELAEIVGRTGPEALKKAGQELGFRCPLDGEYKIGANWAECH